MPEIASLANIVKLLPAITGTISGASGLYNSYEQAKQQGMIRDLVNNPTKMNAYISKFKQPLAAGLLQGTENQAQGYAAERGLATSPALEQSIVSQAIAPLLQQQQDQAVQTAFQTLGLPGGGTPGQGGAQLSGGIQQLLQYFNKGSGGGGTGAGTYDPYSIDTSSMPDIPMDLSGFATPQGTPLNLTNYATGLGGQ